MARILIVDDEADLTEAFRRALEHRGHRVHVADDGLVARRLVTQRRRDFDVILTDLRMRRMGGRTFLETVHPLIEDRTPVIVMSGWPHLLDALGSTRKWAFRVLQKPFEMADLIETVDLALHQRRLLKRLRRQRRRIRQLGQRVETLLAQSDDLFDEARVDGLTRLPNRRRLEEDLNVLEANLVRYQAPFAIAFCDVDRFARFNDRDYRVGDDVVKLVAARLRRTCRDGDTVYRYGGDEFVVLLANQGREGAHHAVDRFRTELEAMECPVTEDGAPARVTMSAGVVAVEDDPERTIQDLIETASRLCKAAKGEGGNRIHPPADRSAA